MASEETPLISPSSDDGGGHLEIETQKERNFDSPSSAYDDKIEHMTYSRRLALRLSKYRWYNPHLKKKKKDGESEEEEEEDGTKAPPSIDDAWAYFEHITLPRYHVGHAEETAAPPAVAGTKDRGLLFNKPKRNTRDKLQKAEPGETDNATRLYSVLKTPESELGDFGIGVGIYFFILRALAIITFLGGLINIPNLLYFASDEYNEGGRESRFWALLGSAICTDQGWEACPTCTMDEWKDQFPPTYERYANVTVNSGMFGWNSTTLTFIKTNHCMPSASVGIYTYASLIFVCVSVYVLGWLGRKKAVQFDEAQQTTTDYSVQVTNPPVDARDANEWRTFFSQFGDVTCCTVAIDNEELIRALIERREYMFQLELLQPPGVTFDRHDLDTAVEKALHLPWYYRLMFYYPAKDLKTEIDKLDKKIFDEYVNLPMDVSGVFVTFETEHAQRNALRTLSVPKSHLHLGKSGRLTEKQKFRGTKILNVCEPPEPSSVRWQDLDESLTTRILQRIFTSILSFGAIIGGCILITYTRFNYGAFYTALMVTAINSVTPEVCRYVTEYESHASEGSKQASLYVKITACLWVDTAIITSLITPFGDTLANKEDSMIPAMFAIFVTEMFKAPVTQLLDPFGHFYRHLIGPRAMSQKAMNQYFVGTYYELSERFTDLTNVLFLTFFYGAIFPAGFFFASATLAIHYWTDKFCLLRNWTPAPKLGTQIAEFTRNYFFTFCILVFAVVSSYNWSGWPFDNACEETTEVSTDYIGTFHTQNGEGDNVTIHIEPGSKNYKFCDMDMMKYPIFPAVPENQREGGEWMDETQARFSRLFGGTSVIIAIIVAVIFFNRIILRWLKNMFFSPYSPRGEAMYERFSDVKEIFGYIPQIRIPGYPFPTLLCDARGIEKKLIGWSDPNHSYYVHNAVFDVPGLAEMAGCGSSDGRDYDKGGADDEGDDVDKEKKVLFTIVKHWPPEK